MSINLNEWDVWQFIDFVAQKVYIASSFYALPFASNIEGRAILPLNYFTRFIRLLYSHFAESEYKLDDVFLLIQFLVFI